MKPIKKKIHLEVLPERAFELFVEHFNAWWPKAYTWSQEKLVEIKITPEKDGLCTETGPFHFRCDWGRVTAVEPGKMLALKWQISPKRVPVPDPHQASDIVIYFKDDVKTGTLLELEHTHFENHGEGALQYSEAMDSQQGWDYILACFLRYAKNN